MNVELLIIFLCIFGIAYTFKESIHQYRVNKIDGEKLYNKCKKGNNINVGDLSIIEAEALIKYIIRNIK